MRLSRIRVQLADVMLEIKEYRNENPQAQGYEEIQDGLDALYQQIENTIASLDRDPALKIRVRDIGINKRGKNALERSGYETLYDIVNSSLYALSRKVGGLGRKGLKELAEEVERLGYRIPDR